MGNYTLPKIPKGASQEQAANIYNQAIDELEHRLSFLQSTNIQEVGGWLVGQTFLRSKDGDVGMSTEDTGDDDIRFWAGNPVKEVAPFRIPKSGKGVLTGIKIQSTESEYPKFSLDPDTGVLGVYYDEFNFIEISPSYEGTPAIYATVDGNVVYQISASSSGVVIGTGGKKLTFSTTAEGDIEILPETGYNVIVPGWSNLLGLDGVSLASALFDLQNQIDSMGTRVTNLTVSVPNHNHGNLDNSTSGGGTFNVDG